MRGDTFISLALIKDQTSWRKTIQKSVDEVVGDKQTISYKKMLEDIEECKFILLEGRPGSGKTTLMNQISRDWAKGEILCKKVVIFVPLRRLNGEADRTLTTILRVSCPPLNDSKLKQLASYIEECDGNDVVFAFDGLDEYVPCYRKVQTHEKEKAFLSFRKRENEFEDVFQLIYGNYLVKSLIVVTSRPAASKNIRQYARKRVEVIGFLEQQITDYIHCYFQKFNDKEKAQRLEIHLKEHPNLMNMAYLPLHCAMLVSLYQEDEVLPNTESAFYKHFTLSTLLRAQIRERLEDNLQLLSFDQLPHDDKVIFDNVCKLAFKATIASKQVFKSSEVDKTLNIADKKLGLLVIDCYLMKYGHDETYTFLHLTFQEYLAAVYIAVLSLSQQVDIIKAHGDSKHLHVMWKFLCGMTDFSAPGVMSAFEILMRKIKDVQIQLQCAYESQNPLLCAHVIKHHGGYVKISNKSLSLSDCVAMGYVVNQYSM